MNKIKEILTGYKNLLIKDTEIEQIAKPRLEICAECPQMSTYPNEIKLTSKCNLCGCILEAKCRSLNSKCPENKW